LHERPIATWRNVSNPCLRHELESVKDDVGNSRRSAVRSTVNADTIYHSVPLGGPSPMRWRRRSGGLEIGERATGQAKRMARRRAVSSRAKVERRCLAKQPGSRGGERRRPRYRDSDLLRVSSRRERRGVDAFARALAEIEVLHEIDGSQDRGAYDDLWRVLFDFVLDVEVRDAVCLAEADELKRGVRLRHLIASRGEACPSRLACLLRWRSHREEGGRSSERS